MKEIRKIYIVIFMIVSGIKHIKKCVVVIEEVPNIEFQFLLKRFSAAFGFSKFQKWFWCHLSSL